ncbi:MAG: ribokinase [Ktedonobacteraceae bacterium]|nr:ribokinase [Ktedonobacteraceae bacterium]
MGHNPILVVGSLNMDQVVRVCRMPTWGETLLSPSSLQLVAGGKGANQAVAIARLGVPVSMAGRVGTDPFGTQLVTSLQADAIDTGLVVVDQEESSGAAFIFLGPDGDNAIVVVPGANMRVGLDQAQMFAISTAMRQARALVLQLEIPLATVQNLVATAWHIGIPIVLNLAPAQPLAVETLRQVSVLVLNETEASLLSGQRVSSVEDARIVGTVLHEQGIATVALTLGSRGAVLVFDDAHGQTCVIHQQAPKVQVVDSTAAGDCFAGALTVAIIEGKLPDEALRFAVTASTLKVTRFGAQSGLPRRAEVDAMLH